MKITIPELSLVVLIGPSGTGKSTFAKKYFKGTEVLSSDFCRGLVSDNENDQSATNDAFEILNYIATKRLAAGKLTVIDATNVQPEARKPLVALARQFHVLPIAIILNLPEQVCHERNKNRPDRSFGPHVVRNQMSQLKKSIRGLEREGFRHIFEMKSLEEIEAVTVERQPLWNNLKHEHGPFDIIGDIHGCLDELVELLTTLGYQVSSDLTVIPPAGRKALFVGDLVDRGPATPGVLKLVMGMVAAKTGLCVPGNHDIKLMRKLGGKEVKIAHGLAESLEQLESESPEFKRQVKDFIDSLISHYVLDDGKLVVAHAGMKQSMQGRGSGKVREFALYGETTGEIDDYGLPVRYNWAAEYRGKAMVVYGHTPVPEPEWLNNTINIDTGCVFGGKLTALKYPERELVSVPAKKMHYAPAKPLHATTAPTLSAQHQYDDLLDLNDVYGKKIITTRLHNNITVREENSAAALEVMSRFAANPKWLVYLPPTMSPSETSNESGLLEHPADAFTYYRNQGVTHVVCEEKHMGSRAVVVICRNEDVALKRFGIENDGIGICYTRTGRRFLDDRKLEREFLQRLQGILADSGFWEEFKADWVCLDCELMPWSFKAQELLSQQYASVGSSATYGLQDAVAALKSASSNGVDVSSLLPSHELRQSLISKYVESYRHYCWPVKSVDDLRLAPFHLLATEGATYFDRDHTWHMEALEKICRTGAKLMVATPYKVIDLNDEASVRTGIEWWESLTGRGGEGMVIKPLSFVARGKRGLVQPALKCRGPEYLRIIYGPEYTREEHLARLRARGLSAKRSLALREFALGVEGLERFVRREPLRKVHECVFGVLAMESEPVDPRL
jgi:protein phosphatase